MSVSVDADARGQLGVNAFALAFPTGSDLYGARRWSVATRLTPVAVGIPGASSEADCSLASSVCKVSNLLGGIMPLQNEWRRCIDCAVLYFNGHKDTNGWCLVNGESGHSADMEFDYDLTRDVPLTAGNQSGWRNCWKCQTMYFDGHDDGNKGKCPADNEKHNGHGSDPLIYNFLLPFNRPRADKRQPGWYNCWACQALVYNDAGIDGRCPNAYIHLTHKDDRPVYNFSLTYR